MSSETTLEQKQQKQNNKRENKAVKLIRSCNAIAPILIYL